MFGLAIWDREKQALTLARDHFGIKPLYVCRVPGAGPDGADALALRQRDQADPRQRPLRQAPQRPHHLPLPALPRPRGRPRDLLRRHRAPRGGRDDDDLGRRGVERRPFTRLKEELAELATEQRPYDDRGGGGVQARASSRRCACGCSPRCRSARRSPVASTARPSRSSSTGCSTTATATTESVGHAAEHLLGGLPRLDQRRGALRRRRPRHLHAATSQAHKIQPTPDEFKADLRRLRAHPGGAAHLDRALRAVPGDARGDQARHGPARRPGRRRDDGRLHPLLLRLPAPAARRRAPSTAAAELAQVARRALPAGPVQAQGQAARTQGRARSTSLLEARLRRARTRASATPSRARNLKKRLVEDLFVGSLPALLRYEDKNTMRFSLEGRVPFLDKEVVKFIFSLVRRGDHQGRLEQAGAARRHPRPAARVDQPAPQQDRLHHPAGRVVHAPEEPLLRHLPLRVVRQPARTSTRPRCCTPSRAGSRARTTSTR